MSNSIPLEYINRIVGNNVSFFQSYKKFPGSSSRSFEVQFIITWVQTPEIKKAYTSWKLVVWKHVVLASRWLGVPEGETRAGICCESYCTGWSSSLATAYWYGTLKYLSSQKNGNFSLNLKLKLFLSIFSKNEKMAFIFLQIQILKRCQNYITKSILN